MPGDYMDVGTARPDGEHPTDEEESLLKVNIATEIHFQFESGDLKGHFGWEGFSSCNGVRCNGFGDRVLNLALGVDADHF